MKKIAAKVIFASILGLSLVSWQPAMAQKASDTQGNTPSGQGVLPVLIQSNMTCQDQHPNLVEFKCEYPGKYASTVQNCSLDPSEWILPYGTITLSTLANNTIDWSSSFPMEGVFVKGGTGGHDFSYDSAVNEPRAGDTYARGAATGDTGLYAPLSKDKPRAVSHISWCYKEPSVGTNETAFAFGEGSNLKDADDTTCFENTGLNVSGEVRWGWTMGPLGPTFQKTWPVYAGAAHCDITKGTNVGTVTVAFDGTDVTVTFSLNPVIAAMNKAHVYAGATMLPIFRTDNNGNPVYTLAPGQYGHEFTTNSYTINNVPKDAAGNIYVIVHADVVVY